MEGNQSRDFLNKLDKLEQAFFTAGQHVAVKGLPFISALRSFKRVVGDCFKVDLKEGYRSSIREFELRYRELEISITPKVCYTK